MLKKRPGTWLFFAVLSVAVLSLLTYTNYQFSLSQPGGNDFLARWTGAHYWVVEGVNPYSEEVTNAAQLLIYGRPSRPELGEDVAHFVYPLPAMLFFAPFGLLPFTAARAFWMTILELALPLLVILSLRLLDWSPKRGLLIAFLAFSLTWYHGVRAVIVGQFAVFEAVLIIASLLFFHQKRDIAAGILLTLTIAKPQMAVLFIPYMVLYAIARRRWRFVLSSAVSTGGVLLVSTLLLPGWILDWIRQLSEYPSYTAIGSPVSILASMLPQYQEQVGFVLTVLIAGGLVWEWALAWKRGGKVFLWAAMATIVATNLIVIRTATTNYVVLIPVLLYIFKAWVHQNQSAGTAGAVAVLLLILVGIWWLFLATVEGNVEGPIPYLPLPLISLVGLCSLFPKVLNPTELRSEGN